MVMKWLELWVTKKLRDTQIDEFSEVGKWGDHREVLDATLLETPFEQLNLVFQKFKEIHDGKELEHVVKDKMTNIKQNAYQDLSE